MKKYLKYISYLGAGTLAIFAGIFVASEKSEMAQAGAPGEKRASDQCMYEDIRGAVCTVTDICVEGSKKSDKNLKDRWRFVIDKDSHLTYDYLYINQKTGEKIDAHADSNWGMLDEHCHEWDCVKDCENGDSGDGGSSYEEYKEYQD